VEQWGKKRQHIHSGSKSSIPKEVRKRRFLSFTSIGISVLDDDEEVLRNSPGAPLDVTWNKANIGMMMQATDIIRCWEFHLPEETWKDEGTQEVVDTTAHPPEFYEPVGLPPLRQKQKAAKYPAPPPPGDGTSIVNESLNSFLGDTGGRLFAANIDLWPEPEYRAEHARIQLKAFLENPKYIHYPHRQRCLRLWTVLNQSTLYIFERILCLSDCRDKTNRQLLSGIGWGKSCQQGGCGASETGMVVFNLVYVCGSLPGSRVDSSYFCLHICYLMLSYSSEE